MGDSGDGGDSSFGIPPADCRNCHPYPLHDGHVDDDGVFGIPPRKSRQLYMALTVNDSNKGYPNIAVTTVTAVTRPPCKGNLPAVFFAAVLIGDMVLI